MDTSGNGTAKSNEETNALLMGHACNDALFVALGDNICDNAYSANIGAEELDEDLDNWDYAMYAAGANTGGYHFNAAPTAAIQKSSKHFGYGICLKQKKSTEARPPLSPMPDTTEPPRTYNPRYQQLQAIPKPPSGKHHVNNKTGQKNTQNAQTPTTPPLSLTLHPKGFYNSIHLQQKRGRAENDTHP